MVKRLLLAGALLLPAGCTVGPDYGGPPAIASNSTLAGRFARAGDAALTPTPGLARWWDGLGDTQLAALVDDALAHSPTIDTATAKIREAQAKLKQQRAAQFPTISASAAYIHADLPGTGIGSGQSAAAGAPGSTAQPAQGSSESLKYYSLGATASWEPDLFGGKRRAVQQARAQAEAAFADLADAQVSLSAQVATAYVNLRDVQERIRLNGRSAVLQQRQLALAEQRYDGGTASALDVERLRNQLESTRADAIPLGAQSDQYLDQLAIYTGRRPGMLDAVLGTVVAVPLPPREVPIGDPASLIAHRPDVRAAERKLASSTAGIGVAKARELPGLRLLGLLGLGGNELDDVFDLDKLTKVAAPILMWNVLDFGAARGKTREAEAQRDQARAEYREAVLEALQDAEDSLSKFGNTRAQLGQLARAEASAARAARLNAQRTAAGTSSVIDQLDIERQQLSAAISVAQAKAQLTNSYIAVNKALGLGWTDAAVPPDAKVAANAKGDQ